MTDSKSPTVSQVFELLNRWRHLPFYSLEPRVSPFFAVFLRDVLSAHFKTEIHKTVIPEFPLRIGTLYTEKERKELGLKSSPGQSYNVDYVAFAKDNSTAYLVELKTDMGSKRDKQDEYLSKAREIGFPGLVEGVKQLADASNRRKKKEKKYSHLLHLLSVLRPNLVSMGDIPQQKFSETKVVFVQPTKDESDKCDFEHIYFKEVANIVQRHGDLGAIFANYLRQWTKEAGSPDPRAIAGS